MSEFSQQQIETCQKVCQMIAENFPAMLIIECLMEAFKTQQGVMRESGDLEEQRRLSKAAWGLSKIK